MDESKMVIMAQSYQEVSIHVREEITTKFVRITPQPDVQKYFFELKQQDPSKYERLGFDTNGAEPYSKTLSDIIFDMVLCGDIYHNWNKIVLAK